MQISKNIRILFNRKKKGIRSLLDLHKKHPHYAKRVIKNTILKNINFLILIPFAPLLVVTLIIRLLRPFLLIRIGNLESAGIGHFTLPIEIYLAEVECGIHQNEKTIDLWYLGRIVCNEVLKDKWKEHLYIFPRFLLWPLHSLNRIIPGGKIHEIPYRRIEDTEYSSVTLENPWQSIDIHGVISKTNPKITFSKEEKEYCIKSLGEIGFDPSKNFVCFNVRDSLYHDDKDLSSHRNGSINDYHLVFNYLNELGYQVIRLGSRVNEKLSIEGPLIFDYASTNLRNDLIDLFLISECSFSVGTGCGLDCASVLFRKMHAYINIVQIGTIPDFAHGSLIIFKRFLKDNKELSLEEIKDHGLMTYTLASQYGEENISFKNNTDNEIKEVLWEIHARVNKIWKEDLLHEAYQKKFRKLFSIKTPGSGISALIGSEFIKTIISFNEREN